MTKYLVKRIFWHSKTLPPKNKMMTSLLQKPSEKEKGQNLLLGSNKKMSKLTNEAKTHVCLRFPVDDFKLLGNLRIGGHFGKL